MPKKYIPKPYIHKLSDIDEDTRTAFCRACNSRVAIRRQTKSAFGWRCNVADKSRNNRPYTAFRKDFCERCGFIPEDTVQLDVHHINYNHEDNEPSNLKTLCANCHRLYTLSEGNRNLLNEKLHNKL